MVDRNVRVIIRASPYDSLWFTLDPSKKLHSLLHSVESHRHIQFIMRIRSSMVSKKKVDGVHKKFPYWSGLSSSFFQLRRPESNMYYLLRTSCFDGENKERRILCRLWPKGGGHKSWITAKSFFPLILRCRVVEFPKIVIFKKKKCIFAHLKIL